VELQRELELLAERLQEAGGVSQAQVAMAICAVSCSAYTHRRPLSRAGHRIFWANRILAAQFLVSFSVFAQQRKPFTFLS